MIRSSYRGRRRATELVGLTLAQALLTAACGSTAPPYIQGTVQAEVRATLAATRRAATTQSQSASVAPSPPPSVEAGPPAPSPVPSPLASAAIRPSTLPSPAAAPASTPPAAAPSSAPPTIGSSAEPLAQQIRGILTRLPSPRTAVFQSVGGPARVDLDSQAEVASASTIKLPLMIATYRQISAGRLSATQRFTVRADHVVGGAGILQTQVGRSLSTTELLETTLTYSDNTGANILTEAIGGMGTVNATMAELGFEHTHMRRYLMDLQAQARGLENTTSAADLTEMLARLQAGALINPEASAEMLRILELRGRQTDPSLDFIGRHLVPRPTIAHVNGTLDHVRNDAGIVELQGRPFILVALLHDQANEPTAEEAIARAAADVAAAVQAAPISR